jgi:nitroreductase
MIGRLGGRVDRGLTTAAMVSLVAALPLLDSRFPRGEAASETVAMLVAFDLALRDGALWPRWAADALGGFGYPLFTVVSPFGFFVAEAFVLAGLGYIGALKAAFIVAGLAAAVAMYLLGRRLYGPAAGLVAAAVYLFLPYLLDSRSGRGALAETFALAWLPLLLWSLLRLEGRPDGDDALVGDDRRLVARTATLRAVAVAGIALGGLIVTDSVTAALAAPLIAAFVLWRFAERAARGDGRRALAALAGRLVGALALGIGLSAVYWLPLAVELPSLARAGTPSAALVDGRLFLHPVQLFAPYGSLGPSDARAGGVAGVQLGLVALVLAGFALAGSPVSIPRRARRTALFFALATAALATLTTPIAATVWAAIPGSALLDAPWRLLAVAAVTVAALAGAAVAGLEARFPDPSAAVRIVVPYVFAAVVASGMVLRVESAPIQAAAISPRAVAEATPPRLAAGWAALLPAPSPMLDQYRRGEPPQKWRVEDPAGRIEQVRHAGNSAEARVRLPNGGRVVLLTVDYPGWTVRIDGRRVDHERLPPHGLIVVEVPPGDRVITARFEPTAVRVAAGATSLSALAIAGVLIVWRRRDGC